MTNTHYFFQSPGSIFLDLGVLQIRWYGLMYAIAFLVCYSVAKKLIRHSKLKLSEEELSNLFVTTLVSGIIGARLWYVFLSWDFYSHNLLEIPQIWHGGQSIQGGILGVVLGLYLFHKNSFVDKLALIATLAPLGQAIGRWGNFFNEEAFGKITNLPWKLYISDTGTFHHPTFLYESLWNLLTFFMLVKLFKNQKTSLTIIASYLLLYSTGRLVIEPIRTDSLLILGMPAASLIAIISLVLAIIIYVYDRKCR